MKIIDEKEDVLLARKTIVFETDINQNPTPSREDVRKLVAKYLNIDKNLVIIDEIRTFFKKNIIQITSRIYKSKEDLKKIEDSNLLKKHKEEEKESEQKEQNKESNDKDKKEENVGEESKKEDSTNQKENSETKEA